MPSTRTHPRQPAFLRYIHNYIIQLALRRDDFVRRARRPSFVACFLKFGDIMYADGEECGEARGAREKKRGAVRGEG